MWDFIDRDADRHGDEGDIARQVISDMGRGKRYLDNDTELVKAIREFEARVGVVDSPVAEHLFGYYVLLRAFSMQR